MTVKSKLTAPFRLTIRGVVADLSEMHYSQQDTSKRTFSLIDESGAWIKCCALGLSARARALANGNDVVLYFTTGRSSHLGSGMLYLMKDSLMVLVSRHCIERVKRIEIPVEGP